MRSLLPALQCFLGRVEWNTERGESCLRGEGHFQYALVRMDGRCNKDHLLKTRSAGVGR